MVRAKFPRSERAGGESLAPATDNPADRMNVQVSRF
jgi:hypothetical protein